VPLLLVSLLQIASFAFKVFCFCWFLLLVRWTLPRFRYDQLMHLGWKFLLPISVLNIFVTAFILLLMK
jgi:NADH-quinone oxidoreductase subunit H